MTAGELDLDTLAERMEAEAVALRTQLIGPLQFGVDKKSSTSGSSEH